MVTSALQWRGFMEIGDKRDSLIHNGKEYRFCCASCRWAFEKNPDQFIKAES